MIQVMLQVLTPHLHHLEVQIPLQNPINLQGELQELIQHIKEHLQVQVIFNQELVGILQVQIINQQV